MSEGRMIMREEEGAKLEDLMRGFSVTRAELLVLLKHWKEISLDMEFTDFWSAVSGNRGYLSYVNHRVGRIAEALGDDKLVKEALGQVHEAYAKEHDGLAWKVFTGKATEQEGEELRLCQAKMQGCDPELPQGGG